MLGTLRFITTHARMLAFGFLAAFSASFGQTYFIALFSEPLRETFSLSHGGFGTVYMLATLTSASLLVYLGAFIDRMPLGVYTTLVAFGLAAACAGMALAPGWSPVVLYVLILGLRMCGQGLFSHISATTMARSFDAGRGRALSLAVMGHPAGEALFPLIAVALIMAVGWRWTWGLAAIFLIGLSLPTLLWLGLAERRMTQARREARGDTPEVPLTGWTRAQVLRDPRFYLLLPTLLAPGFINTGVFFAQVHIADAKGWPLALFASGFIFYAGASVLGAFASGPVVDRFTAFRLMPLTLPLLALAMLLLGLASAPWVVFAFMSLAGFSNGALATVKGAMWAEVYGTAHLGAIRSMGTSIMVFSTALSPALMGWSIDNGVSVTTLALGFAGLAAFGVVTAWIATLIRPVPAPAAPSQG